MLNSKKTVKDVKYDKKSLILAGGLIFAGTLAELVLVGNVIDSMIKK